MVKLSHELSTITPQQMEGLGCALGCTNTDIEMMLRCSSMQECILSLLQRWVRNYHLPTTEKLAQALKKSGCLDKTNRLISSSMCISLIRPIDYFVSFTYFKTHILLHNWSFIVHIAAVVIRRVPVPNC